jgi:tetratricopeptide (TPR) repeat protein
MNDLDTIRLALAQLVNEQRSPAELLGVEPRVLNGLFALGVAARDKGRHTMADNIFQRCLMMNPFRADFWIALAASRQALGRAEEAGEMYQIAGLLTTDAAPVAYAAACFAQAGQVLRAQSLADWAREQSTDDAAIAPWLAVVDAHARKEGASCR